MIMALDSGLWTCSAPTVQGVVVSVRLLRSISPKIEPEIVFELRAPVDTVAYAFVSSLARAAMSTTAPTVLYAVAGTRVALARTDGDPARRYTAMQAATSAITALP